ncbi:MAG: cytochrome b/b6 domain-containing protein [Novosphingobium sp.]|nr:cytochrome b/b6 domain-containing protein [Novosphingobium sp.]
MVAPSLPVSRLKVWDAPVRLFHWALAGLIGCAWWTGEQGMLDWHRLTGYAILTLLLFRLAWGFAGSTTARFSQFLRGPRAVAAYLAQGLFQRGTPARPGHNPAGGWSVLAMLSLLFAQVALGFFAVDVDGLESGPFAYLVDFDTGRAAAQAHHLVFNLLLALIALHVLAIAWYRLFKRENLVGAMLTGSREWTGQAPPLRFASPLLALVLVLAAGLGVWALIRFFGQA